MKETFSNFYMIFILTDRVQDNPVVSNGRAEYGGAVFGICIFRRRCVDGKKHEVHGLVLQLDYSYDTIWVWIERLRRQP